MGFEINPYNPCVVNKIVNGHEMTICWHVDDLKVSHKDENAVTALAENLAEIYGPNTTVYCGKYTSTWGWESTGIVCRIQ